MNKKFYEGYIPPCQIFGNVYFVGTRPASTHIIDTGDGLILIDPGFPQALDTILENIQAVGLDPMDIRIILLSHGHYDHSGAAAELSRISGGRIYLGEGDLKMVTGEEDSSLSELFQVKFTETFTPDVLIRDGDVISLGNTQILCLSTPGHTDGTLSFFFHVTEGEYRYRVGMFGGAGTNTLTKEFLTSHGLPLSEREKFFSSIKKLRGEKVDVFLGNHVGNNDTEGKISRVLQGEKDAFISHGEWEAFLSEREAKLCGIIKKEIFEMQETINKILEEKIIMIVRGVQPNKIEDLAEAMWRGGIRLMECTYDATGKTPDETVANTIAALTKRFEGRMLIGAGTVLTKKQVELTAAAGGRFIISPDVNSEIISETKKAGMVSIPGALTPSEVTAAVRAGADFVKLFPISDLGAGYVKAISAPLSHVRFLAVGGVKPETMTDYLKNGALGVGMGVSADDKEALARGDLEHIESKYRAAVERLNAYRSSDKN